MGPPRSAIWYNSIIATPTLLVACFVHNGRAPTDQQNVLFPAHGDVVWELASGFPGDCFGDSVAEAIVFHDEKVSANVIDEMRVV